MIFRHLRNCRAVTPRRQKVHPACPRPANPGRGPFPAWIAPFLLVLALAACNRAPPDRAPRIREVGFRVLQPATAPLLIELPGRVAAVATAEVRPQASGVIERRLFEEGALVRAGQPLYRIDDRLYRAAAAQAEANLAAARANAEAARARADRFKPLAAIRAVSDQEYTDAAATARQSEAAVAQARAALQLAQVNLRFTTVPAPISGRIGRSLATVGALVTATQASPLALISRLDNVAVDLQQGASDLARLRSRMPAGAGQVGLPVHLLLEDGTTYQPAGKLEFAEVTVDPATGTITLRARFPNPQGLLLPGMFVRAVLEAPPETGVFLVPASALSRDPRGNAQVWLVGPGNKAQPRTVTASRMAGMDWVVTSGLKPGDRLITQGLGRVKPNAPIRPVPEGSPQRPAKPQRP